MRILLLIILMSVGASAQQKSSRSKHKKVKKPWTLSLSTSVRRNFDQYSNATSRTLLSGSYQLTPSLQAGIETGYDTVLSEYDANQLRDVYGLRDTTVSLQQINVRRLGAGRISPYVSLRMPTSKVSQNSSLVSSIDLGVAWKAKFRSINMTVDSSLGYSYYEFDTADEAGTRINSPIGWLNSVSVSVPITKRWRFSTGGYLYAYQTFRGDDRLLQIVALSSTWRVTKKLSLTTSYTWQDNYISNLNAFDDDTSVLAVGLGFSL